MLLLLVSVTFLTLMGGDLSGTWSLFDHPLTPLVVLVDWIAVGRNQAAVAWWHPITWVGPPLAYLVYLLAAVLFAENLLYGCAEVKSLVAAGATAPQPPVRY